MQAYLNCDQSECAGFSGKPDPPYDLQFVNATHNSITIRWKPGFNGGLEQSFRVRYKPTEARGYIYVDVSTPVSTLFTITGNLCFMCAYWGRRMFYLCGCECVSI